MADIGAEKLDIYKKHYQHFRSRAALFLCSYRRTKDSIDLTLYYRNKWYADGYAMGLSSLTSITEKTLKS